MQYTAYIYRAFLLRTTIQKVIENQTKKKYIIDCDLIKKK